MTGKAGVGVCAQGQPAVRAWLNLLGGFEVTAPFGTVLPPLHAPEAPSAAAIDAAAATRTAATAPDAPSAAVGSTGSRRPAATAAPTPSGNPLDVRTAVPN